jgi:VWFA-related protein
MRRFAVLLSLAVCPALLIARQQPTTPQKPTFRAATELVAIDVSVVDRDGRPVKDLRNDEFVVKVDGQVRRLASVQFVDQTVRQAAAPRAPSTRPVVSSNEAGGGGRLVLIVVDEASIKFGGLRAAAESANRLLAGFGASDRIGLATLPGPRMLVDFGRDRQRIVDALKRIPGGATTLLRTLSVHNLSVTEAYAFERADSATVTDVITRECGALKGVEALACPEEVKAEAKELVTQVRNDLAQFSASFRALLQALAANDVPKIVILFSEGLLSPEAPSDLSWVAYEAAAARTVIHTIRLDRTMFDASERNPRMDAFFDERGYAIASLDTMSGATRGLSLEIATSSQGPFDRLAREVSGFYLLGMEPESTDRDGRHHRIQVQALRPGVTVRARSEFALPAARTAPAGGDAKLLMATMQSPMLATGIPVRLATFNMADEDPAKVRVMVAAEIDRQQEKDGAAQVGYAIYTDQGKPLVAFSQAMDLLRTESGALGFVSVAAVPAGSYTLKLAAVRDGQAGSVEHAFTARLTSAASLRLGDLVVSDAVARDRPMPPSLDSRVAGDSILAFVQIRGDRELPKGTGLSLDIVKTEDGRALLSGPLSVGASKTSVRMAQGVLEGRLLPPGEYGARVTVSVGGKPAGRLFTQFSLDRTSHGTSGGGRSLMLGIAPAPFAREEVLAANVIGAFLDEMPAPRNESVRRALERVKAGRFAEAAQQLTAAGDNDPLPPFIRGLDLYAKGQLDPAANAFREAIHTAPDFVVGMFYIAACYAAGGKEQHAINAWQTSLISLDHFPFVYGFLVDALLRSGQAAKATELLDEAASRWPDDEGLRLRAAKAAAAAGHSERVLDYLDRMGDRPAADPNLLFLGMYALFQQALDSTDPPAERVLERLTRYRDAYAAAGGPYQPLVAEWVSFVEQKSKRTR